MELRTGRNKTQVGLLLLPGVAMFAIFTIYPIIKLFLMSFLQWDFGSMLSHKFIGLENYKAVLGDETFRIAFANTIIYPLVTVGTDDLRPAGGGVYQRDPPLPCVLPRHLLYHGDHLGCSFRPFGLVRKRHSWYSRYERADGLQRAPARHR